MLKCISLSSFHWTSHLKFINSMSCHKWIIFWKYQFYTSTWAEADVRGQIRMFFIFHINFSCFKIFSCFCQLWITLRRHPKWWRNRWRWWRRKVKVKNEEAKTEILIFSFSSSSILKNSKWYITSMSSHLK